jgi:uncharacterized protein involved in response to NO
MTDSSPSESVFFSYGFRPFFLLAGIWASIDIIVWMALFEHGGTLPSRFDPLAWHIHEMLFGFIAAAIAGFLLTAVANWTGRPPIRGFRLGLLITLWLAGRVVCLFSSFVPEWVSASVDLAFLLLLALMVGREVTIARNWRNLVMVAPVLVLAAANLLMHCETEERALPPGLGWRLGISAVLMLLAAVSGRVIPAFTRNWLAKQGQAGPGATGMINSTALAGLLAGLLLWVFLPGMQVTGIVLLIAAGLNGWRWIRWQGVKTRREPLLFVLHIGYGWLIAGAALLGAAAIGWNVPLSGALHSLTVGAMATMILAIMTRATRGHTGRPLSADRLTQAIFVLISLAALARVLAAFQISANQLLLVSAGLWLTAFLIFLAGYGPMFFRPNVKSF